MKNILLSMMGILLSIYVLGTGMCVYSLAVRENALEEHVSRVLERTLTEEYREKDEERVRRKLTEELSLIPGKNGSVEVDIPVLDLMKGLIQVEVKEHFRQFNGRMRTIGCKKLVLVDAPMNGSYSAGANAAFLEEPLEEPYMQSTSSETSGTYTNAYEYYQEYEGKMIFKPEDSLPAGVYYGTRAKQSSSGNIVFRTIGWQVTIQDKTGAMIDRVYYSLNGENIQVPDNRVVNDYKYKLYNITLENLKSRMSAEAREALKKADCSIVFDACIVVVKYGEYLGGMTDEGIEWGKVYTTYDGIVNAQSWSAKTKEALKDYFNKDMADMFFEVDLSCGEGIASVSGGGKYCYGTEITIDATAQSGYTFLEWVGAVTTTSKRYTFTVTDHIVLKATTKRDEVAVNLFRNYDRADSEIKTLFYTPGAETHRLPEVEWKRTGYYLDGWSTSRIVLQSYFSAQGELSGSWLERVVPSVNLYAVWKPNNYRIVFRPNGAAVGEEYSVYADYEDVIVLPEDGFRFRNGSLGGWSLHPDYDGAEYLCGQSVTVAELAQRIGVVEENGETIYLYAQPDSAPQILGGPIYLSLADAQSGIVTAEFLCSFLRFADREDGELFYEDGYCAEYPDGGCGIQEFRPFLYIGCTEEIRVQETFYARDSAGNETYRDVVIYLIEDVRSGQNQLEGRLRFFSMRYYKDVDGNCVSEEDGGLLEDSVWYWNDEYRTLLEQALQNM